MKKIKRSLMQLISVALVTIFCCCNAAAEEIVTNVREDIIVAYSFPLDLTALDAQTVKGNENENSVSPASDSSSNASSDPKKTDIVISLRNEFSKCEEFYVEILHWQTGTTLLSEFVKSGKTTKLCDVEIGKQYQINVRIFSTDKIRYYNGSFIADKNKAGKVSFNNNFKEDIPTSNYKYYTEQQNNANKPELTNEKYAEMYNHLDIPSFIDESSAKEYKHIKRMDKYEDSYDTIGFENYDGTYTVYSFTSPVRYKDKDGKMHDYDANLLTTDKSDKASGYEYFNKYNDLTTYFTKEMSNDKGTKIVTKAGTFEYGLYTEQNKNNILYDVSSTVSSIFKNDNANIIKEGKAQKVEYNNVTDSNYSIKSEPTIDGAKTSISLTSIPKDGKIKLWINNNNLLPLQEKNGNYVLFVNKASNRIIYKLGCVEVNDSFAGNGEGKNSHLSTSNKINLIESNDSQTLVEIIFDKSFLESPLTIYPLNVSVYASSATENGMIAYAKKAEDNNIIEQNSSAQANKKVNVSSTRRAAIVASTMTSTGTYGGTYVVCEYGLDYVEDSNHNYFADRTLYTDNDTDDATDPYVYAGTQCNSNYSHFDEQVIVMKYGTQGVVSNILGYAGNPDNIKSAYLQLNVGYNNSNIVYTSVGPGYLNLMRETSSWTEATASPSLINNVEYSYSGNVWSKSIPYSNYTYSFNITTMVKDNAKYVYNSTGKENQGFIIRGSNSETRRIQIYSKNHSDASKRPRLQVTYTQTVYTPHNVELFSPSELGIEEGHGYNVFKVIQDYNGYYQNKYIKAGKWIPGNNMTTSTQYQNDNTCYKNEYYWTFKYLGNGVYNIVSSVSEDTYLATYNNNETVISDDPTSNNSRWVIQKYNGSLRFLSVASNCYKYLDTSPYLSNSIVEFSISNHCNTSGKTWGHVLKYDKATGRYYCINCSATFDSPQSQDKNILDPIDLANVATLYKAYFYKLIQFRYAISINNINSANLFSKMAEGCLRNIDAIRSKSIYKYRSTQYAFRDNSNNYVSEFNYIYDASTINMSVVSSFTTQLNNDEQRATFMLMVLSYFPPTAIFGFALSVALETTETLINSIVDGESFWEILGDLADIGINAYSDIVGLETGIAFIDFISDCSDTLSQIKDVYDMFNDTGDPYTTEYSVWVRFNNGSNQYGHAYFNHYNYNSNNNIMTLARDCQVSETSNCHSEDLNICFHKDGC